MTTKDLRGVELLTLLRKRKGLTLKDLAMKTKISAWKLEDLSAFGPRSRNPFSVAQKNRIAAILGVELEMIFENG
jgi:transcriptional regulator with XRE-family HTH domain